MDSKAWLIGFGLVFMAGTTRGFSGFGSAMILSPGLSFLFNPQQVVATVILLEMTASVGLVPEALAKTKWRKVLPMVFAAIVMIPIGAYFLILLDPLLMRRIIGGLILIFVVLLLFDKHIAFKQGIVLSSSIGACSGFLTGLTGMGGPPVVLYELSGRETAAANRANLISFFALTQFVALISYWLQGILSILVLRRFLILLLPFLLGLISGRFLFKWVSELVFHKVVLGLLVIIGFFALSL